jgi:hypothetical protein
VISWGLSEADLLREVYPTASCGQGWRDEAKCVLLKAFVGQGSAQLLPGPPGCGGYPASSQGSWQAKPSAEAALQLLGSWEVGRAADCCCDCGTMGGPQHWASIAAGGSCLAASQTRVGWGLR